jgi:hypothetical protein
MVSHLVTRNTTKQVAIVMMAARFIDLQFTIPGLVRLYHPFPVRKRKINRE